jgi:FKBP-type peptidyl-prolyl cis-trans isomerase FkpA
MKLSYVVLAALIVCAACSKNRKAPNGYVVEVIREGTGDFPKPGQYLVMNMMYKDSKDSVWLDTKTRQVPVIVPIADTSEVKNEKGIESAFRVMKKNDSVRIRVSAKEFYATTRRELPPNIKPEMEMSFFFGVKDVLEREGFEKLIVEIQNREAEKARVKALEQVGIDSTAIDAYLESKNIKALKAEQGLRYVIHRKGNGGTPSLTDTIRVTYKGSLLTTGFVFDQSNGPVDFPLTIMIRAWQILFPLIPRGSKATFYVPSSLGYGANGYPPDIPANANLVFDIELIAIKSQK